MQIRDAEISDSQELLAIYAPFVKNTAITYEYDVPSLEEFTERIKTIKQKYPYIVAIENGKIIGYAYAAVFKARKAYDWSCETTIYINDEYHKQGVGKALYSVLEEELKKRGITNMYACVATTETEDEYLTNNSMHFHQHIGFRLCGEFKKCAKKFDRWYDMVWLEKFIGEHN